MYNIGISVDGRQFTVRGITGPRTLPWWSHGARMPTTNPDQVSGYRYFNSSAMAANGPRFR